MKLFVWQPIFSVFSMVCAVVFCSTCAVTGQQAPAAGAASGGETKPPAARGRVEYATFQSASLGRAVNYAVSLPASYDQDKSRRYPVVIFLHGLFNSERDCEGRGIEAKLQELRTAGKVGEYIVAMPYGENSFYINSKSGVRYEDAIVKDFIPFVDKSFRTIAKPEHRLIEGISMGGYGALLIAFKHPELFSGVVTHCAALFEEAPKPPASASDMRGQYRYKIATELYGNPPDTSFFQENNPLYLAKTNAAKLKKLKIYFDVGSEDRYGFDVGNKLLNQILTDAGVEHEFTLAPGNHGWSFLLSRGEPAFTCCWKAVKK